MTTGSFGEMLMIKMSLRFLQMFTDLGTRKNTRRKSKNENINQLKILLANQTTSMLHGKTAAVKC